MPTIDATPGSATANSYCTEAEADAYFDERLAIVPAWPPTGDPLAANALKALITATKKMDALFSGHSVLRTASDGSKYLQIGRKWTGSPATTTQKLAWPRIGMLDRNGNAIDPTTIPDELKDAEAEFAGQLLASDRTLDNDVATGGITSVKAGSVAVTFREDFIVQPIPDAVIDLLPQSWFEDEATEPAALADFGIV